MIRFSTTTKGLPQTLDFIVCKGEIPISVYGEELGGDIALKAVLEYDDFIKNKENQWKQFSPLKAGHLITTAHNDILRSHAYSPLLGGSTDGFIKVSFLIFSRS